MGGRSLRIAIYSESYLPYLSGVTVAVDSLARGLTSRGHAVLVVAPRPGVDAGTENGAPGVEHAWLPSYELRGLVPPGYRMPRPLAALASRHVDAFKPDVVHAHSPFVTGIAALAAARRARVPLVFTHHTRFGEYRHYLGPLGGAVGALLDRYLRQFWLASAAVVAPSMGLRDEIRARVGRRDRPVVRAIATGVDVAAIRGVRPVDPRGEAGWPADAVVAVSVGRIAREKNVDVLLDAFAVAVARAPSIRLLMIGGGPAFDAAHRRAERDDLAGRVAFTGPVERGTAMARLRCADLFVFASQTETQGLVLAESLAAGVPVVALDGPAVGETVRDGTDGLVVTPGERGGAAALGAAIAALAADQPRRRALAAEAASGAHRLSSDASVDRVVELYRELVA